MLTLGSLFDGIGGWQLAGLHNDVKPIWSSEIEKFPLSVTRERFPDTIQLGDITQIDGAKIEPVDIVCAGSPCQDLSVAGKQEGLSGKRSGLFYRAINLIRQMQVATNGEYPKFFVWENVPGAFSSNKGMDFKAVLEEITESEIPVPRSGKWSTAGMVRSGKCDVAWRVLDAQYWGVPQRRKRVFLVADFRAEGRCADKILFECKSVSGNTSASGAERESTSDRARESLENTSDVIGFDAYNASLTNDISPTIRTNSGDPTIGSGIVHLKVLTAGFCTEHSAKSRSIGYEEEISPTLREGVVPAMFQAVYENHANDSRITKCDNVSPTISGRCGTGGNNLPLVLDDQGGERMTVSDDKTGTLRAETHGHQPLVFEPGVATRDGGHIYQDGKAPTLRSNPGDNFPTVFALEGTGVRPSHHGKGYSDDGKSFTLNTVEHHAVAYGIGRDAFNQGKNAKFDMSISENVQPSMVAKGTGAVLSQATIRRLTPLECERLQGLPDNFTLIDDRTCSDSARYKALGNGMAQPCADFIISQIKENFMEDLNG